MAQATIAFYVLLTASACLGAEQRDSDLKSLYEAQRWFELRDAVEATSAPAFYRGVVACAFQSADRAERYFQQVIRAAPRSEEALEAHGLLASAYMRTGRYRRTLSHL